MKGVLTFLDIPSLRGSAFQSVEKGETSGGAAKTNR